MITCNMFALHVAFFFYFEKFTKWAITPFMDFSIFGLIQRTFDKYHTQTNH